ncbi:MAG: hypothetical protein HY690_17305 [Chloroflexi bacterium]|nr:hypothetical protein [Chloroflexota bacterium]
MKEISVPGHVRRMRLEERVCPVCGQAFPGTKRQRYCGASCERRAYYARHADELKARHHERYHQQKGQPAGEAPPGPRQNQVDCRAQTV